MDYEEEPGPEQLNEIQHEADRFLLLDAENTSGDDEAEAEDFEEAEEVVEVDDEDESEALITDELLPEDPDELNDPPDHWSPAEEFGNTLAEERRGESLMQRLSQEEPDDA